MSKLDISGFNVNFGCGSFSLSKNTDFVGSGFLIGGLYQLKLENVFAESLLTVHCNNGFKRSIIDDYSASVA